ncbi:MAG: universal stress protein [Acidobacteriota bacterium]
MKIMVAYDGSPPSEAAVGEVLRRPWPEGSEVRLVTVVEAEQLVVPPAGVEVYGPLAERIRVTLRENSYRRIQAAMEKFRSRPELQPSYELRDGSVKRALLQAIREWGADLVVLGSTGTSAIGRMLLGSVCHALLAHAPCNVEIVKVVEPHGTNPAPSVLD